MTTEEFKQQESRSLRWLSDILDILRTECPWDTKQTAESLRYLTIEEVYELSEAVLANNPEEQRKELGDIFMHILFYSKIAADNNQFTLSDVIDGVCQKLIVRHPHISLPDKEGVRQPATSPSKLGWEQVKMREGRKSVLEGVPTSLPALEKAVRMQEKAAGMGFEFPSREAAFSKVKEEYAELQEVLSEASKNGECEQSQRHVEEEYGDLLFAIVKWGRFLGVNAEDALSRTNLKFKERFLHVENCARQQGKPLSELTPDEMTAFWKEAKANK